MKLKFAMVIILLTGMISSGWACDACGCALLGGVSPSLVELRRSFIRFDWRRSGFHTASGIGEGSKDVLQSFVLSGQYQWHPRWKAQLIQSYRYNTRQSDLGPQRIQGLSDLGLNVNYVILDPEKLSLSPWHLEAGAGIMLPIGKYVADIHDRELPENFSPGNGSFGGGIHALAAYQTKKTGVVLSTDFTEYLTSTSGYRFGHQWTNQVTGYYRINMTDNFVINPFAGVAYEVVGKDHYANNRPVLATGGQMLFGHLGLQVQAKRWLTSFQYDLPLAHHFANGEVVAEGRLDLQFTYLFN